MEQHKAILGFLFFGPFYNSTAVLLTSVVRSQVWNDPHDRVIQEDLSVFFLFFLPRQVSNKGIYLCYLIETFRAGFTWLA
jgi:hypothetical protein